MNQTSPARGSTMVYADGMDRRQAIRKILASMGVVTFTVGSFMRPATASSHVPTIFCWGSYDLPELHKEFVEKHGAPPEVSAFSDLDEAFAKMRAGFNPDITTPGGERVQQWIDSGILAPIDTGKLRHWPEIFDEAKFDELTIVDGTRFAVPFSWGSVSVVFRTDMAPEYVDNQTWKILWDPKYSGKISIRSSADDTIPFVARMAGIVDHVDMSDAEIDRVKDSLIEQRSLVRYYWSDNTALEQSIASGEVVAANGWSTSYLSLKKQGIPVGYMKPKEGPLIFTDFLAILKDSPASEAMKYDLIDSMISPESGAFLMTDYGAASPNRKAFELVDPQVIAGMRLDNPQAALAAGIPMQGFSPATQRKVIDMFESVKAGFE